MQIAEEDAMEEEEGEAEPPKVELTEEEKKMWFRPQAEGAPDLTSAVLNQSFGSFSIPEQSEGFDAVNFEWQGADASKEYLRTWVLEKKRTTRIEDLQPGQWFQDKLKEWQKLFSEWQAKQKTFKSTAAQREKEAAAKKKAEEKKDGEEGEEGKEDEEENQGETVDIFAVGDVCDVGGGEPLFKDFAFEDWALLQLRFELYMLQVAFRKDVDDPDRLGVHEQHLAFYYQKYFRKQLTPKNFGVSGHTELTALVKDTATWDSETKVLSTPLQDDIEAVDIFVKLTEENRRERQRRIDAGDETARLKFSALAMQQPSAPKASAGAARTGGGWPTAPKQGGFRPSGAWQGGGGWAPRKW